MKAEAVRRSSQASTEASASQDEPADLLRDQGNVAQTRDRRDSRWDEHRRDRREQLVEATLAAVGKHGAGVGMEEIAAEAGTSKTVVYRHFTDRTELYVAVCTRVASQLLPKLRDCDREQRPAPPDGRRGHRDLPRVPRGRPRALPLRRPRSRFSTAPPTGDPISNLSDLVGDQAAPRSWPALRAGRPRSAGRRALGPRRRRDGPFGRRLVAARGSPHAPRRTRCSPDRSRLGRPLRRRRHPAPPTARRNSDQHRPTTVDPTKIQEVLDGRWAHVRRDARENLNDPDFLPVYGENDAGGPRAGHPAAKKLADTGRVGLGFPKEYGGEDDSGGSVTSIEMLAFGDLSLMVKAGVQWGLFGGACSCSAPAPPRQVPARRHELRPARLLRHDRDRPRLRRPAAAHDVHLRPGDRRRSTCTPRTRPPARTTSATRPRTAGWPSSSPS